MAARADSLALAQPFSLFRGTVETFSIANPAAAGNFTRQTGQGYWERYIAITFTLVTDANAANRQVSIEWLDADNNRLTGTTAPVFEIASTTFRYYGYLNANANSTSVALRQNFSLPWLFLQPGWSITSNINGVQAGDQISAIRGVVERIGIGPDGTPVGETAEMYTERGRGYERALESE